jgi:hypothetical protein
MAAYDVEMIQATLEAYAPGSTPDVAAGSMVSPFAGILTPSFTALAGVGPFDDGFEGDNGRSSPTIEFSSHGNGERLHGELSSLAALGGGGVPRPESFDDDDDDEDTVGARGGGLLGVGGSLSPTSVVPDASLTDMDDALFDALLSSIEHPTPEWAKGATASSHDDADFDLSPSGELCVKTERFADDDDDEDEYDEHDDNDVPASVPRARSKTTAAAGKTQRPRRGPGSRRKLQEEIHDELDDKIYKLVPADKLRLPKAEFQEWRESSGFPKLTGPERRRLAAIRRMILARVYAERNRLRKLEENERSGQTLAKLKAENAKLKAKVAKMEEIELKFKKAKAELDRIRAASR